LRNIGAEKVETKKFMGLQPLRREYAMRFETP
jgi:hypothetical protein